MAKKADEIREAAKSEPQRLYTPIDTKIMVSTGSTLLDLAISGGRVRGGGLPGGIMVELYGPSSSGKTALMVEIGASVQDKGGEVRIADPEARLDQEYSRIYGLELPKDKYSRPDTVNQLFNSTYKWKPPNTNVINMYGADSIAALSSELELSADGDKRGQKKAKDLSEGCRKTARIISEGHKLIVLTNQERQGDYGKTTPGGFAVPFHASLRIRVQRKSRVEKEKKLTQSPTVKEKPKAKTSKTRAAIKEEKEKTQVTVKKTIGILSECLIKKSSIDDEYRTAPLYIIFGHGIDDIRANLQWYKDMTKNTQYLAVDKEYAQMDWAIKYIEDNELEGALREMVIDLWEDIENAFKTQRKKKRRF